MQRGTSDTSTSAMIGVCKAMTEGIGRGHQLGAARCLCHIFHMTGLRPDGCDNDVQGRQHHAAERSAPSLFGTEEYTKPALDLSSRRPERSDQVHLAAAAGRAATAPSREATDTRTAYATRAPVAALNDDGIKAVSAPSLNWRSAFVPLPTRSSGAAAVAPSQIVPDEFVIAYLAFDLRSSADFLQIVNDHRDIPLDDEGNTFRGAGYDPGNDIADHWCPGVATTRDVRPSR